MAGRGGRPHPAEKEWPAGVAFGIPEGVLRAGDNDLVLTVRGNSWWRYDGLALVVEE